MDQSEAQKVKDFQILMLRYFEVSGRKLLPWRLTNDPWQILITEVLLRKTTAEQVREAYSEFILSPEEYLFISDEDLIEKLKPLGMYQVKAAIIKYAAQAVVREGKQSLGDEAFLASLSGIGRYIQNTVLCFAFDKPKPALDTNMIRVIKRVFGYKSLRSREREDKKLWKFAETLVPVKNPKEYNWAVLDLGALVCKPKPLCSYCPLQGICCYYQELHTDNIS